MIKVYQYEFNKNIHYIDFIKSDEREKETDLDTMAQAFLVGKEKYND